MDEFVKILDKNLEYVDHSIAKDTIYIDMFSIGKDVVCPYRNASLTRVHSRYKRSSQDLPVQDEKVMIILDNRKMFCTNPK